jgi:hypothetical protein
MRRYQGSLQVDQSTLIDLLHTNEARHVKEAYTPEGARVLVELPAQELPPPLSGQTMQTRIQQITPSLNIKTDDLHAFTEDVDAHESVDSSSNETTPESQALLIEQQEAIDLSMLADPSQLIEAFGRYTKMDASWFDKWQDHPSLKNAIKRKGTPGRGRTTKPLFCPFLVMHGLMKKPRRGNKRQAFLNDETPWRMLKQHFPRVYDMHKGESPLDDLAG